MTQKTMSCSMLYPTLVTPHQAAANKTSQSKGIKQWKIIVYFHFISYVGMIFFFALTTWVFYRQAIFPVEIPFPKSLKGPDRF